jgi:hypothetical protein
MGGRGIYTTSGDASEIDPDPLLSVIGLKLIDHYL